MESTADKSINTVLVELFFAMLVVLVVGYFIEAASPGLVSRIVPLTLLISSTAAIGSTYLVISSDESRKRKLLAGALITCLFVFFILIESGVSMIGRAAVCVAWIALAVLIANQNFRESIS